MSKRLETRTAPKQTCSSGPDFEVGSEDGTVSSLSRGVEMPLWKTGVLIVVGGGVAEPNFEVAEQRAGVFHLFLCCGK